MKVSDILRVKGNILITVTPDEALATAVQIMSEKDLGSLVVMEHGDLVGMLTFREVMKSLADNDCAIASVSVSVRLKMILPLAACDVSMANVSTTVASLADDLISALNV